MDSFPLKRNYKVFENIRINQYESKGEKYRPKSAKKKFTLLTQILTIEK